MNFNWVTNSWGTHRRSSLKHNSHNMINLSTVEIWEKDLDQKFQEYQSLEQIYRFL